MSVTSTQHASQNSILRGYPIEEAPPPPPDVETLADLFEWQASRHTTSPLFSFSGDPSAGEIHTLSYSQVYDLVLGTSSCLHPYLQSKDVAAVVGVWLEKSVELHLAILSVVFAGAGWLPFDADAPTARVTACLCDSAASVLLCDRSHLEAAQEAAKETGATVVLWNDLHQSASQLERAPQQRPCRPRASDTAYFIYTSGSTGTPKGIEISHGAALTFALSEQSILETCKSDIVWQGFSAAFDMFVEETWVSIAGGAHLMIGSRQECQNVSGLGGADGLWSQRGITVVNAVPTLINIMTSLDEDSRLPASVRLLNLGGEACPPALVERLWHDKLRIINTYGPSETTVTATYQVLLPGRVVTIGKPLPSYHALLLPIAEDYEGRPVPHGPMLLREGVEGELGIGGPCLGKGYVGRADLTAQKFVPHPLPSREGERLYRTGDRVRLDANLDIIFLGRIDTQVKHRGFRIELGEIESALSSHADVQTAAVILSSVATRLEAYVVTKRQVDLKSLRSSLSALPAYMQPEAYFFLQAEEMPRLPSGKINAKALQETSKAMYDQEQTAKESEKVDLDIDETSTLALLLRALTAVFPQAGQVLPDSDFFDDLGGHSLAAAVLVSKLRKESGSDSPLASIGLQDIYLLRTAQKMADKFAVDEEGDESDGETAFEKSFSDKAQDGGATGRQTGQHWPISQRAFILCGIAQVPALLFFFFLASIEFLVPYLVFFYVLHDRGVGFAILATYGIFIVTPLFLAALGVLGKWIALGRAKAGEYPLYGVYYYRVWLADKFVELINISLVADGPLHPSLMRLLGAKVGLFCHIGTTMVGAAYDLVEIGDDVVIGQDVVLAASVVERGRLILKHIVVGSGAHIGSSSVLEGGACMQDEAELAALSMLPDRVTIPSGQRWHGSPARHLDESYNVGGEQESRPSWLRRFLMGLAMSFSITFIFPVIYFAPQIPSLLLFEVLNIPGLGGWAQTGVVALPASLAYILLVFTEMVALRWIVLGVVKAGSHYTTSVYYFRHWFVERLMAMSLIILQPVYATLYVVPFLRILGVKIGKWAEVSTARGMQFQLCEVGDESFIADNVLMGNSAIRGNRIHMEKTTLDARAFAGNGAIIPQGTHLPSNSLVGVLSIAPDRSTPLQNGQSCFGSPPVLMPARQQGQTCHASHLLYRPRWTQVALRLFIEGLRIWLPRAIIIFGLGFGLDICQLAFQKIGVVHTLLMLPFFYFFLFALPALVFTVLAKWILVGRYCPAEWPLWSHKVWLSEFITSLYETLLETCLTHYLRGTPFLAWCFRLLGVKIGARVVMLSSDITEYDMVTLGDEAVINQHAGPQTHLFEDRVMKIASVTLEERAVMKPYSICLPGSKIGADGQLGSLSLLMKGESVPPTQAWEGAPIAPRQKRRRSPFKQPFMVEPAFQVQSSGSSLSSVLSGDRPRGNGSRAASSGTARTLVTASDSDLSKEVKEVA